jgi:hypothetical protein
MSIIGHTSILQYLQRVHQRGALSHAYLFSGPEHVGKRTVAYWLSGLLLHVSSDKVSQHLDFLPVIRGMHAKTGKTKKNIDIDQIRAVRSMASRASAMGGSRVVLIEDADAMSIAAANSLLKTLEEPPEGCFFILLTSHEGAVPDTIRSRAHAIHFSRVRPDELHGMKLPHTKDHTRKQHMIDLCRGLPGLLVRWENQPETFDAYQTAYDRIETLVGKTFFDKRDLLEPLFGDKTDHVAARDALTQHLRVWQVAARDMLVGARPCEILSNWQLRAIIDSIDTATRHIMHNVHPRLAVEQILFHIP